MPDSCEEWLQEVEKDDKKQGLDKWRANPNSELYDHAKIAQLLAQLRECRRSQNAPLLLYLVRTTFSRNNGNMGDERLYSKTPSGTKNLIEDYIKECIEAINYLVKQENELDRSEILRTLLQTRRAFGSTALTLSGGSILGFLHTGVLWELIQHKLLPRIVSGSSAGSIFAACVCIHRDEEFHQALKLLDEPQDIFEHHDAKESLRIHIQRFAKYGTWTDGGYLRATLQRILGDYTFGEAHQRTGRILNVTVSTTGSYEMPHLLNYLTAPDVLIWSAVSASCSAPLIFESSHLLAKNPRTHEVYEWTKQTFFDGSVDNDLPLARLGEMFNVDHVVACQVNPHIAPIMQLDEKLRLSNNFFSKWWMRCRSLWYNEVSHALVMANALGFASKPSTALLRVMAQDYIGDVTVLPRLQWSDIIHLFSNPSTLWTQSAFKRGRQAIWPKIAIIHNHCAVEFALDRAILDLRIQLAGTPQSPLCLSGRLELTNEAIRRRSEGSPTYISNSRRRSYSNIRLQSTTPVSLFKAECSSLDVKKKRRTKSIT